MFINNKSIHWINVHSNALFRSKVVFADRIERILLDPTIPPGQGEEKSSSFKEANEFA